MYKGFTLYKVTQKLYLLRCLQNTVSSLGIPQLPLSCQQEIWEGCGVNRAQPSCSLSLQSKQLCFHLLCFYMTFLLNKKSLVKTNFKITVEQSNGSQRLGNREIYGGFIICKGACAFTLVHSPTKERMPPFFLNFSAAL